MAELTNTMTLNGGPATETPATKPQYQLRGFSGCSLEVRRVGFRSFVTKRVNSEEKNSKLLAEVDKLERLDSIARETGLFSVPAMRRRGIDSDGLAFYEIEFIPSWELDSHMARLNPCEIEVTANRIFDIIAAFATVEWRSEMISEGTFIHGKFQETLNALRHTGPGISSAERLISMFEERIENLRIRHGDSVQAASFCHGDLALDNVLVSRDGALYLIDPLVNGHESYLWDVSKVFQSSLLQWRQIKYGEFELDPDMMKIRLRSPSTRTSLFNDRFARLISKTCDEATITLYMAATIARAAKYSQDCTQLRALLILTIELLDRYAKGRCELNESLSALRG